MEGEGGLLIHAKGDDKDDMQPKELSAGKEPVRERATINRECSDEGGNNLQHGDNMGKGGMNMNRRQEEKILNEGEELGGGRKENLENVETTGIKPSQLQ